MSNLFFCGYFFRNTFYICIILHWVFLFLFFCCSDPKCFFGFFIHRICSLLITYSLTTLQGTTHHEVWGTVHVLMHSLQRYFFFKSLTQNQEINVILFKTTLSKFEITYLCFNNPVSTCTTVVLKVSFLFWNSHINEWHIQCDLIARNSGNL